VVAVTSAMVRAPLGSSVPVHPPDAAHEVALVEVQVKVADLPLATELGAALIDAVGAGEIVLEPVPTPPLPQAASSSDNPSQPWLVVIGIKNP
jgi:hypothetical protein